MNIKNNNSYLEQNTQLDPLQNFKSSQVLEEWKDIKIDNVSELCIHQIFEAQVERSPDAIAVVFENEQLTYRQLNQRANQLAHHLRTLGIGSEVLVGICVERSLEMVVGLLGILKAGGAYVPLDPAYPLERLAFILEDTQTQVLLLQKQLLKSFPTCGAQVVCLDSDWEDIAHNSQENLVCETTVDNLIYVIYTSGSTGQPKGVAIPHRGICNQLYWRQTVFGLTETDRVLQTISFSFDPSVWQIFWSLCFGGQLILPCPGGHQDSAYLVKLIAEQQITVIALVPSMLRVLLEEKEIENCQCLRHISCGGEVLPVELIERFFTRLNLDNVLHNVYGPTEASIDATFWTCQRGSDRSIAPIGLPITNAQIYILDLDLQPLAVGEPGELHIGGIGLARGYLNRPDLTAEKFIPNPFSRKPGHRLYKTGDLARYLPDGNIEFLGRIDHQVKIRGFRIELEEIEAVLSQHPSVQISVVVAREEATDERRLVAYIVLNQEQETTISELRNFLRQKLANYMVPSAFIMLNALPLTPNGKVDRRALPAPNEASLGVERTFIAPRDTVELQLTQIWQEVLGIQPIGVTDNFFDLGGHSLIAIRLLAQIKQRFDKTFPLSAFLQAPTVEQFANILQEESQTLWESLVPIQTNGKKTPLFCLHDASGNVIIFHNLARHLDSNQPVYALQPRGLDGKQALHSRIEDMASDYIRHIRTIQPEGPYLLAGFSSGGVVAFEIAQQLQAQGQKVALLALFDAKSPLYFKPKSFRDWIAFHSANLLELELQEKLSYLISGVKQRLFDKITSKFYPGIESSLTIAAGKTSLPNNLTTIEQDIFKAQKQAVRNYIPQVYSAPMVLFRCIEQIWWVGSDRQLGWGKLVTGGLEVHDIPGNHETIVRANVEFLAAKLRDCLPLICHSE